MQGLFLPYKGDRSPLYIPQRGCSSAGTCPATEQHKYGNVLCAFERSFQLMSNNVLYIQQNIQSKKHVRPALFVRRDPEKVPEGQPLALLTYADVNVSPKGNLLSYDPLKARKQQQVFVQNRARHFSGSFLKASKTSSTCICLVNERSSEHRLNSIFGKFSTPSWTRA